MKRIMIMIFGVYQLLQFSSCSHSKHYDSCGDMMSSLKDVPYKDLVKEWGEPYYKDEYVAGNIFYVRWKGVGISNIDAVFHFETILYSWGETAPFTVKTIECEPHSDEYNLPIYNNVTSKEKIIATPDTMVEVDSTVHKDTSLSDDQLDLFNLPLSMKNGRYTIGGNYGEKIGLVKDGEFDFTDYIGEFQLSPIAYVYVKIKKKNANTYDLYLYYTDSKIGIDDSKYSKTDPIGNLKYKHGNYSFQYIGLLNIKTHQRENTNDSLYYPLTKLPN